MANLGPPLNPLLVVGSPWCAWQWGSPHALAVLGHPFSLDSQPAICAAGQRRQKHCWLAPLKAERTTMPLFIYIYIYHTSSDWNSLSEVKLHFYVCAAKDWRFDSGRASAQNKFWRKGPLQLPQASMSCGPTTLSRVLG